MVFPPTNIISTFIGPPRAKQSPVPVFFRRQTIQMDLLSASRNLCRSRSRYGVLGGCSTVSLPESADRCAEGLHQGAGFVDAASAAFSLARAPARVLAKP
jgi:hypothetical protein